MAAKTGLAIDGLKRRTRASTWFLGIGKVNRAKGRSISSDNSKHAHLLACISLKPPAHFMQRVRSVKSHSHLQYTALPRSSGKQARVRPRHQPGSCQYLRQHRFLILRFFAVLCFHVEHAVSKYFVSCESAFLFLSVLFLHIFIVISRFPIPKWPFLTLKASNYHTQDSTWYFEMNPGTCSMPVR